MPFVPCAVPLAMPGASTVQCAHCAARAPLGKARLRRTPGIGQVLGAFVPGVGHFHAGYVLRGLGFRVAWLYLMSVAGCVPCVSAWNWEDPTGLDANRLMWQAIAWIVASLGLWIWQWVDASLCAEKRSQGIAAAREARERNVGAAP